MCYIALKATEMLALKDVRLLLALKTSVIRSVNSHCLREFVSSECYISQP